MTNCPCGKPASFDDCCAPYLNGSAAPATAEALMRSRYTAYVKGEIQYLIHTLLPEKRRADTSSSAKEWSSSSEWLGLEVKSARGGESDKEGLVEFVARYRQNGVEHEHHEISKFKRIGGRWFFADGKVLPTFTDGNRPSQNSECPCGSGKKFKRCCGAKKAASSRVP